MLHSHERVPFFAGSMNGALSHQPPTQERPRTLADVIGWCLSSVRLQSPACGALVLVTDPEDPRPQLARPRGTKRGGELLLAMKSTTAEPLRTGVWLTPMASHGTRETISLKWNGGGGRLSS
jgi:hypothetical protein